MRSSRQSQASLSSVSSRNYESERSRPKAHSSRHSMESLRKSNRKMKFIIAVGVALPIIAAIIGVVAWAVSADNAFQGRTVNSLRRSDANLGPHEEDIFQLLEDRQDLTFTHHPSSFKQESQRPDLSRLDGVQSIHQNSFDDTTEKDPLYIVHFVPSPKPKVEHSTPGPNSASTVSSDVLQKILSASKGAKPGTPQFVVFAPIPSAEDDKGKEADLTSMGAAGLNFISNPPTPNKELDYDYEEELRKYQELLDNKDDNNLKDTPRVEGSSDKSNSQTQIHKESIHLMSQNVSSGNIYKNFQQQQPRSVGSNIGKHVSEFNQQPQQIYPQVGPQNYLQNPPVAFTENVQKTYPLQNYNQQQPNYNQPQESYNQPHQIYQQPTAQQANNYQLQPSNSEQLANYQPQESYNQPHQIYQQPTARQANNYQLQSSNSEQLANYQLQQPHPIHQPAATARSGQYEPLGIKVSLGNGGLGGLLGGGGYSPLGIISSILSPIIKRPRVNLNGKLMFGVMLEKGVKFGEDKAHHQHVAYG